MFTVDMEILLSEFGIPATIKETGHADKQVSVIYDQNSLNEMGALTDRPQATLNASDLSGVDTKTATITINSTAFRMTRPMPDGSGFVTVLLTRA